MLKALKQPIWKQWTFRRKVKVSEALTWQKRTQEIHVSGIAVKELYSTTDSFSLFDNLHRFTLRWLLSSLFSMSRERKICTTSMLKQNWPYTVFHSQFIHPYLTTPYHMIIRWLTIGLQKRKPINCKVQKVDHAPSSPLVSYMYRYNHKHMQPAGLDLCHQSYDL